MHPFKFNSSPSICHFCFLIICLSPSSQCCMYQHIGYKIHHNITTSVGRDNCTKVILHCGGKEGEPQIDILTDHHDCPDGSCQEAFEDLSKIATDRFNLIKAVLDEIVNSTAEIVNTTGKQVRILRKIKFIFFCLNNL